MVRRKPSVLRARFLVALTVLAVSLAAVRPASASELLAHNASNVKLKVDGKGRAVVYYTTRGRRFHPVVWGAVNARHPNPRVPQVSFRIDYSGGYMRLGRPLWKTIRNRCRPYDGPPLAWLVTACKAPDGSYWALQRWQRLLPALGIPPWSPKRRRWDLRISHWTGELAKLEAYSDWIYGGRFHRLFGRYTYLGVPVHGFRATRSGSPLDGYGRNIYVDTYNSAYGPGWKRENGFLAHRPRGNFCYGFYPRKRYPGYPSGPRRPAGHGERYRATTVGPGVTPDVVWGGPGLPDYDPSNPAHVAHDQAMNALGGEIAGSDPSCPGH